MLLLLPYICRGIGFVCVYVLLLFDQMEYGRFFLCVADCFSFLHSSCIRRTVWRVVINNSFFLLSCLSCTKKSVCNLRFPFNINIVRFCHVYHGFGIPANTRTNRCILLFFVLSIFLASMCYFSLYIFIGPTSMDVCVLSCQCSEIRKKIGYTWYSIYSISIAQNEA